MRKSLMLVVMVMLAALVFAPAAFAQDDNPSGDDLMEDDRGGEQGFDDNPSADDLGGEDRDGARDFDDNPTGDDMVASPTASASSTASATSTSSASPTSSATPTATASADSSSGADSASALPSTGGTSMGFPLPAAAGVLLIGSGIMAAVLLRRRTS